MASRVIRFRPEGYKEQFAVFTVPPEQTLLLHAYTDSALITLAHERFAAHLDMYCNNWDREAPAQIFMTGVDGSEELGATLWFEPCTDSHHEKLARLQRQRMGLPDNFVSQGAAFGREE
ncbi:MAG: hypothetical protein H6922_03480 [Pseudomonadaceae bacterium]|nr:hypothetical protein [Pseudomonadaceae bacterium]